MRVLRLLLRVAAVLVVGAAMVIGIPEAWATSMWKLQTTVNPSTFDDELNGVSQAANGQTWAVGTAQSGTGWRVTLIEHHPGGSGSWTQQTSPGGISNEDNVLQAVRVRSASNVWAVGWSAKTASGRDDRPVDSGADRRPFQRYRRGRTSRCRVESKENTNSWRWTPRPTTTFGRPVRRAR